MAENVKSELVFALLKAREMVGPTVYKGGYNDAQRFAYVGHEQVVRAAKDALTRCGLTLVQRNVEFKSALAYRTNKGETQCFLWEGTFDLEHVGGESRSYTFAATTQANDKSAFVASTALDRTALLRVLGLAGSNEEDPEHNSHDEPEHAPPRDPRSASSFPQAGDSGADELGRLKGELEQIDASRGTADDKRAALVFWAADLRRIRTKLDKGPLWSSFADVCASIELAPAEIVSKADEYNRTQGAQK